MQQFVVNLTDVNSFADFVCAFNAGFCKHIDGNWHGKSWDAFHDYLSWPDAETYVLVLQGWEHCKGISGLERAMIKDILSENPHVNAVFN